MTIEYVYLLPLKNKKAFKIGITANPETRLADIGAPVEVDECRFYKVPKGTACKLERKLHKLFARHRIYMPYKSGNTEWFKHECYPEAVSFMEAFSEDFGVIECCQLANAPQIISKKRSRAQVQVDRVFCAPAKPAQFQNATNYLSHLVDVMFYNGHSIRSAIELIDELCSEHHWGIDEIFIREISENKWVVLDTFDHYPELLELEFPSSQFPRLDMKPQLARYRDLKRKSLFTGQELPTPKLIELVEESDHIFEKYAA